jgi:hypothetical protein
MTTAHSSHSLRQVKIVMSLTPIGPGHQHNGKATQRSPIVQVETRSAGGYMAMQTGTRLLPWPSSPADTDRRAWNIASVGSHRWTALDGPPMPADQKAGVRVPPSAPIAILLRL